MIDMKREKMIIECKQKDIVIKFLNEEVFLKNEEREEILKSWNKIISESPYFFNGEVLTVVSVDDYLESIEIAVAKTNYAHYLYTKNNVIFEHPCKILAVGTIVISSDGFIMAGITGRETEKPGIIQFIGGGVDKEDLIGRNGIKNAALREIKEEVGVKIEESIVYIYPKFIIDHYDLLGIGMIAKSILSRKELYSLFMEYKKKSNNTEIESLIFFNIYDLPTNIDYSLKLDETVSEALYSEKVRREIFNNI